VPVTVAIETGRVAGPELCRGVWAAAFVIAKTIVIATPSAAIEKISFPGLGISSGKTTSSVHSDCGRQIIDNPDHR
jgi:hypothetical protein